ncbi:MAG: hydroxyacylglutathione hydrolase [Desulfobacterales bacterium]|nr:hydroxyacylglutathione hydrolase [Desulfobacterales bacterium]
MEIKQFKYSHDNFGYLVYSGDRGVAIDMGAPEQLTAFTAAHGITVTMVTNTHNHHDHTPGNGETLEKTGAEFVDCRSFNQGQILDINGEKLEVILTPGHTEDSVCFAAQGFMVTGDTLFNGTVGNCFSGDLDAFYHSLKRLMAYPPETLVYSGHDYVKESLNWAAGIDGHTPEIRAYMDKYDPDHVVSTLAQEMEVNPYLQFDSPKMTARLEKENAITATSLDRFKAIMEIF